MHFLHSQGKVGHSVPPPFNLHEAYTLRIEAMAAGPKFISLKLTGNYVLPVWKVPFTRAETYCNPAGQEWRPAPDSLKQLSLVLVVRKMWRMKGSKRRPANTGPMRQRPF